MATLDWVFLGVLMLSILIGACRGLVYEVLALANWVAAFVLAQWLAPDMAQRLPMEGASELIRYGAAFVLVFVVAIFAGSVLTWLASRLFQAVGLRPADRALGAVFGLMRGAVVLLAAAVLVAMTPFQSALWWTESAAAAMATATVKGLKPVLPQEFGKYLP